MFIFDRHADIVSLIVTTVIDNGKLFIGSMNDVGTVPWGISSFDVMVADYCLVSTLMEYIMLEIISFWIFTSDLLQRFSISHFIWCTFLMRVRVMLNSYCRSISYLFKSGPLFLFTVAFGGGLKLGALGGGYWRMGLPISTVVSQLMVVTWSVRQS